LDLHLWHKYRCPFELTIAQIHKLGIGNSVCGKATVTGISGEDWPVAQILAASATKWTISAGVTKPRNSNPLSNR
jgi:hypothetical protein